jgi:hypothetical protein
MNEIIDIISTHFDSLKKQHDFTCSLKEEVLKDNYMMVFDSELNAIVYDPFQINKVYREGVQDGAYLGIDLSTIILLSLIHELGHYYDLQDNPKAFYIGSKEEYIQMELRGIEYAKAIVPDNLLQAFNHFNGIIMESYKRDLPE